MGRGAVKKWHLRPLFVPRTARAGQDSIEDLQIFVYLHTSAADKTEIKLSRKYITNIKWADSLSKLW